MHSLAAACQSRLSETEPKSFVFETSCHAFGGRLRRFAKVNVNKVNILSCICVLSFVYADVMYGGSGPLESRCTEWVTLNK